MGSRNAGVLAACEARAAGLEPDGSAGRCGAAGGPHLGAGGAVDSDGALHGFLNSWHPRVWLHAWPPRALRAASAMCEKAFPHEAEALHRGIGAKKGRCAEHEMVHFFPRAHTSPDPSLHSAWGGHANIRGQRVHRCAQRRPAGAPAAGKVAGRMRCTLAVEAMPAPPRRQNGPLTGSRPPQGMWKTVSQQKRPSVVPGASAATSRSQPSAEHRNQPRCRL